MRSPAVARPPGVMAAVQLWCRVTVVGRDGAPLASWVLEGPGAPALETVEDVAISALLARRLGGGILLAQVSPALRELLALAGLPVEVEGETKRGEEPLGVQQVQEEVHPGDLAL